MCMGFREKLKDPMLYVNTLLAGGFIYLGVSINSFTTELKNYRKEFLSEIMSQESVNPLDLEKSSQTNNLEKSLEDLNGLMEILKKQDPDSQIYTLSEQFLKYLQE